MNNIIRIDDLFFEFENETLLYEKFIELQNDVYNSKNIDFDLYLITENIINYTIVFLISSTILLCKKDNKRIGFFCNKINFDILKKLRLLRNNVVFDPQKDYSTELDIKPVQENSHIFNIITSTFDSSCEKMSLENKHIFISNIGEIFNNAIEHSNGIVFGTKYLKNSNNLYCFSCYDTGIGIPQKVIDSIEYKFNTQKEAFQWALESGNTTVQGCPRGIGFSVIKRFIYLNGGIIRIYSGNIKYIYNGKLSREIIKELEHTFQGTLFEIDMVVDNRYNYRLE